MKKSKAAKPARKRLFRLPYWLARGDRRCAGCERHHAVDTHCAACDRAYCTVCISVIEGEAFCTECLPAGGGP